MPRIRIRRHTRKETALVADLEPMTTASRYAARAIVRWHVEKAGGRVAGVSDDALCAVFNSTDHACHAARRAEAGLEAFFK